MTDTLARIEAAETRHLSLYAQPGEVAACGDVRAVYAGPDLPVNVAAGFGTQADEPLDEVEAFFARHGLPARLLLYSHAAPELLGRLAEHGYILTRLLHAYVRTLTEPIPQPGLQVMQAQAERWAGVASRAFGPGSEAIMRLTAGRAETRLYLAELDGEPIAAGAMSVLSDVALLFSTATLPKFRGRGGQTALLRARLRDAQALGADLAAVLTAPGSASERNVRRAGFGLVGARLSFERTH